MHLKNIFMLSVAFYTAVDASFSIVNDRWRAASPDSFIAQETVPASSDIACASIASSKSWVNLYKYEDNTCQLSPENRIPTSDPEPDCHVKSKLSPDDCLLSNGSVVREGQQAEFSDCATYVCENNHWVILTERNLASSCVSPFTSYNGGCYYYVTIDKSWCDARRDCFSKGADLIDVYGMSTTEMDDLASHYGESDSWIGIKRETPSGGFLYMTTPGKPSLSNSSSLWEDSQPNESDEFICGNLISGHPGLWDHPCSAIMSYICEIKV